MGLRVDSFIASSSSLDVDNCQFDGEATLLGSGHQ